MSFELRSRAQRTGGRKGELTFSISLTLILRSLYFARYFLHSRTSMYAAQVSVEARGREGEDGREGALNGLDVSFLCELTSIHLGFRSRSGSRCGRRDRA